MSACMFLCVVWMFTALFSRFIWTLSLLGEGEPQATAGPTRYATHSSINICIFVRVWKARVVCSLPRIVLFGYFLYSRIESFCDSHTLCRCVAVYDHEAKVQQGFNLVGFHKGWSIYMYCMQVFFFECLRCLKVYVWVCMYSWPMFTPRRYHAAA